MSYKHKEDVMYGTTIICLKVANETVIAGDGQVSLGPTVVKSTANKLRTINNNEIVAGFAGSTADAFTLFQRLEEKLDRYPKQLMKAAVSLAKDWRNDKYLRRLEAMLIVANKDIILAISGNGDVIEPDDNVFAIGSGGNYALSAAKGIMRATNTISAEEIARKAMEIAAEICVYTNANIRLEKVAPE